MKKWNIGAAAVFFAISAFVFVSTAEYAHPIGANTIGQDPGSAIWPRCLAVLLADDDLRIEVGQFTGKADADHLLLVHLVGPGLADQLKHPLNLVLGVCLESCDHLRSHHGPFQLLRGLPDTDDLLFHLRLIAAGTLYRDFQAFDRALRTISA